MVFGIRLFLAFMGHILMDEMQTFLLNGHMDVLGTVFFFFYRKRQKDILIEKRSTREG